MTHVNGSARSVGTLVKQGTEQLSDLVRQEMKLAQAELAQKGKRAGIGGGLFGAAGLMAFFAWPRWSPRPSRPSRCRWRCGPPR